MATTVHNRHPPIGPAHSMEMGLNTVRRDITEKAAISSITIPITVHTGIRINRVTATETIDTTNTMRRRAVLGKMIIEDRILVGMAGTTQIEIVNIDTTRTTMAIKTGVKVSAPTFLPAKIDAAAIQAVARVGVMTIMTVLLGIQSTDDLTFVRNDHDI